MKKTTIAAAMLASAVLSGQDGQLAAHWDFEKGSCNSVDQKFEMIPRTTTKIAVDKQTGTFLSVGEFDGNKPQGIVAKQIYPELSPAYFKLEIRFRLREKTSSKACMFLFDNKYLNYIHPKDKPEYNKGFCVTLNRTKDGSFYPALCLGHGEKSESFLGKTVQLKENESHTLSVAYTPENNVIFAFDGQVNKLEKAKSGGPVAQAIYATTIGDRFNSDFSPFDGDILEVKLYSLEAARNTEKQ